MSLPFIKVAIGLGAAGGISGAGYLAFRNLSLTEEEKRISVSKLFEQEGRILLTKGQDSEQWNARWKSYVGESKNTWGLADYETKKSDTSNAPDSFVERCVSDSKLEVLGVKDSVYLEVVKNCSKELTLGEFVNKSSGITLLDTTSGNDAVGWSSALKNYLNDNGGKNPWTISGLPSSVQQAQLPTSVSDDFRSKCSSKKSDKVFWAKDPQFANFTRWCTKTNSSVTD